MTKGKELPPDEAWEAIQKLALEEEAERVGKLSDEEIDQELAQKGIDPKALRQRGKALAERLAAKPPAPVIALPAPPPRRGGPLYVWIAAAAIAAAVPVAIALIHQDEGVSSGWHPSPSAQAQAAGLRDQALRACREGHFPECERGLDEAKALDPSGEERSDVREARRRIEQAHKAPPSLAPSEGAPAPR
jgi:hypothetical protein